MFTWPSAPVLAQYLFVNRSQIQGKTVIEVRVQDFMIMRLDPQCANYVIYFANIEI